MPTITIRDKTDAEIMAEVVALTGLLPSQVQVTREGTTVRIQTIKGGMDTSDQAINAGAADAIKNMKLTKVDSI